MPLDAKALLADVTTLSEYLMKLMLDGGSKCSTEDLEQLRRFTATASLAGVPEVASQMRSLEGTMRAFTAGQDQSGMAGLMDGILDCFYTCRAVKTYLQGKFTDQPALERIFGKDLPGLKEERMAGLELLEVGYASRRLDEQRQAEMSFLLDLASGQFLADEAFRTATAERPSVAKRSWSGRLRVEMAHAAPGFVPRRVRMEGVREEPLTRADIERALTHAKTTMEAIQREYRTFRSNFFAPEEFPVLVSPKGFYAEDDKVSLVDRAGHLLPLGGAAGSAYLRDSVLAALPSALGGAVFGMVQPAGGQLMLVVRGVLGIDSAGSPVKLSAA